MDQDFRLMPEQASSLAAEVDQLYSFLLIISGVITIAIAGLIIYFAIKYRRGSSVDRSTSKGHFVLMETSWIVIPFLLTMVMFFWGARLYFQQYRAPSDTDRRNRRRKRAVARADRDAGRASGARCVHGFTRSG